jgi:hypothetical protein
MQPTAKDYAEEAKWRKALEPIIRKEIAREIEASNANVFMLTPETIRAHYAAIKPYIMVI